MATVLIIDDDVSFRRLIGDITSALGHRVVTASGVGEALQLLDQLSAVDQTPELIFVDFHMGDKTGFDLIRAARARPGLEAVPIVMFSSTTKKIDDLVAAEGVEFINKNDNAVKRISDAIKARLKPPASASPAGLSIADKVQALIGQFDAWQKTRDNVQFMKMKSLNIDVHVNSPMIRFVDELLLEAIKKNAVQVELIFNLTTAVLRLHAGGRVEEAAQLPGGLAGGLSTYLKSMGQLNVVVSDRPQDGRFRRRIDGKDYEFLMRTEPSPGGENVIIRLG